MLLKPELLSPAGTLRNLHYAFAYGADAVYAGQPRYSLRVRNNDFQSLENLATGIQTAHDLAKKFYLAVNIAPHNSKVKSFLTDLEPVVALQPDALIMSDPGLILLARERWPAMPIHLSVQANTVNYAAVRFWQSLGLTRIILSRELSLEEIAEIRQQCPDMELEVFVHGALCIAYSGRCLLSGYMNHRDSNQGTCTNACRWGYQLHPAQESASGDLSPVQSPAQHSSPVFLLEEAHRPGDYLPIFEDEHGTYIMNSKDLRAVQHVAQLTALGIDSLKIEGRTKSHYYVALTAQVYRRAIDDAAQGRDFDRSLMDELEKLASRGYTEGFYRRHVHDEYQNYQRGVSLGERQQFVGEVLSYDVNRELLEIDVKNRFLLGDRLELMLPTGNHFFTLNQLEDGEGNALAVAKGSGHLVWIRAPAMNQALGGLLLRELPEANGNGVETPEISV